MNFEYGEDDDEEGGEIQIDSNDLDIITDKKNWKPTKAHILAYAKLLGFDVENDPPELLKIAEKYLTIEIPEEYCRAFTKGELRILYVNVITNDIETSTEIEEAAMQEYKEAKEKLKNEENKIKVIPRKKIAPIGAKKSSKDTNNKKEKEILKNKEKSNENIKEKNNRYDEEEDDDYDFDYSGRRYEIDSKQNKINNKKIIDKKESEKNVLNLKDSEHIIQYFDNPSSEDEDDKSIKPIPSKKNLNLKKEKSAENIKVSKEFDEPPKIEDNKFNSINPKYQRSNKKRQNLRYERRSLDVLRGNNLNILHENKNGEISNEDNKNSKNNKNNSINLNISKESSKSVDLQIQKNNYKENIRNIIRKFKTNLKINYIKNKKDFIDDFINEQNDKNSQKLKELKEDNKEIISSYEKELKNKMNKSLEDYKNKLIKEYNEDFDDIEDDDENKDSRIKNLELKYKKLKSEINIQTEKNNMKKELSEQKKKNELNEKLKILGQNQKIQISNLERKSKDKIEKLSNEYKTNFILFQKQYELKNKNDLYNDLIPKSNNDSIQVELIIHEKELKKQYDISTKELKDEYDNKLHKDIEEFRENIIKQNDKDKLAKENKYLEKDYFNIISELKKDNKYIIKNIEETIKNLFEKTSTSFDKIKNKSNNDINILMSDINKKINETANIGKNEDKNGILISDYLSELISKKLLILNKYNSYVDIAEEEYKQNIILIEYFIEIIRIINEIITDNNQKSINLGIKNENLNEILINEILKKINDLMEEYKYKYEEEQNNKFYPLLNDSLQKLMNLKFDNEYNNNIPFNSFRYKGIINSNHNISNVNYLNNINNSLLNDSNYNNNYNNFNSNRTINNINPRLDELEKTTFNINNNIISPRKAQMNNSSIYYNPPTQRNNFNSNLNNTINPSSFRANNNIFPIKEDIESNLSSMNISNIDIPQLPNELLNSFSSENLRNYKLVINFLVREYKQINEEQNIYLNRNNANQKLNILKESGEYLNYNNLFEQMSKQENDKNSQYLRDIESKKNILELIKNNCEESFSFIMKYNNKSNIINNKLGILITHIEDYNKHFNARKNNYLYSINKSQNIDNMLNNTFQINNRNYNQQSILSNTFSNRFELNNKRLFNNTYNSLKYFH